MDDLILRQAVLDAINTDFHEDLSQLEDAVKQLPPVNPQKPICPSAGVDCEDCPAYEPKTGHWIEHEKHIECDSCSVWFLKDHLIRKSYCPNCGAKMAEGSGEE